MGAKDFLYCVLTFFFVGSGISQHYFDCPENWQLFDNNCYHFAYFPKLNYESARIKCSYDGAALVSVNSFSEHNFISEWLSTRDPYQRSWFTSGARKFQGSSEIVWKGDGTEALPNAQFWLPEAQANSSEDGIIVYMHSSVGYGWAMLPASNKLSYICEIKQAEAYRIVQHNRDFDYGIRAADPNNLERGPVFTKQPTSTIILGGADETELECVAFGNPSPNFKWFKLSKDSREQITAAMDSRYTITNGKLTISEPNEILDSGDYQCEATNKFGTIVSNTIVISFGRLGEFSNVRDAAVKADAFEGVAIQCSKITAKPAARYQWMKGDERGFIRTSMQPHIFVSGNGKLYFSEVTVADAGEYRCLAELSGLNDHSLGYYTQVPRRSSLPIELIVQENSAKAEWGPEIQNDFLAIFPQPPLRGKDVRIECFAYGTSKVRFIYEWSRKDNDMPEKTRYYDSNRIILIPNAELEDQGTYTCKVRRGQSASDEASVVLRLGSKPYFIANLQNQHVDTGAQLTWRCEARGNPSPTYTWFKDGVRLEPVPGETTITGNVFTIESLDSKKHDGMYQCGAENTYGTTYSSAQLRVLSFKPNFSRFPMSKISVGSIGGNMTLMCKPEGAPTPDIVWYKNGAPVSVGNGHFEQVPNGFLVITNLQKSDEARYSCTAINMFGEATDTTRVQVGSGTKIDIPPTPTRVNVNSTAFIFCEASHDPRVDMVYVWKFNGHLLKNGDDPHIRIESGHQRNGLYILSAQQRHRGLYECTSVTPLSSDKRAAYLSVFGPPGEPGGVYVEDDIVTKDTIHLRWTPGATHGSSISYYIIESRTENDDQWRLARSTILEHETVKDNEEKRFAIVAGLNPGVSYYFRVKAANSYGVGPPSLSSPAVSTPHAPPIRPVQNVRGGGGSVGELSIKWDKLPKDEQGGNGIGYIVYWRQLENKNGAWRKARVGNVGEYFHVVGEENYYLEYEVKIQALNNEGRGANSSIEIVYSAADMPQLTPTNVESDTYNGTAIEVSWEPVADTRETAKGKILGYQINYWPDEGDYWLMNVRHEGQRDSGLVIGLESDQNFWVDVQMYNSAGLGPRSEAFVMETSRLPTNSFPEEVRVFSHGEDSCRVWWRGITTTYDEALITGYRVYYWEARETFMAAKHYDTIDHQQTTAVIDNLDKDVVYALRVGGLSAAGEGKKSPTLYFTLGGQIQLDQLMAQSIQGFVARSSIVSSSITVVLTGLLTLLILFH